MEALFAGSAVRTLRKMTKKGLIKKGPKDHTRIKGNVLKSVL